MKYIKCVDPAVQIPGAVISTHNFATYDLPRIDGAPGDWSPDCTVNGRDLKLHEWGYHLAEPEYIANWFTGSMCWAEAGDKIVQGRGFVVSNRMRLTEPITVTDAQFGDMAFSFAAMTLKLPTVTLFTFDFDCILKDTFSHVSKWYRGEPVDIQTARDHAEWIKVTVGRFAIDRSVVYDFQSNGHALFDAAMSVAFLPYVKRPDGVCLMDMCNPSPRLQRALQKQACEPYEAGCRKVQPPPTNWQIAREIAGQVVSAASHSVRQVLWHGYELSPMQKAWVDASPHTFQAPPDYHAAAGVSRMQSQIIRQTLGF